VEEEEEVLSISETPTERKNPGISTGRMTLPPLPAPVAPRKLVMALSLARMAVARAPAAADWDDTFCATPGSQLGEKGKLGRACILTKSMEQDHVFPVTQDFA